MLSIKRGGCAPDALLGSQSWPSHVPWPTLELSIIKYQVVLHGETLFVIPEDKGLSEPLFFNRRFIAGALTVNESRDHESDMERRPPQSRIILTSKLVGHEPSAHGTTEHPISLSSW